MPELPEVQTVVSQLKRKIIGKKIIGARSDWKKNVLPSFNGFARSIKNASVTGTRRFGKQAVIDLDNGYSLVAHLKMTGHFLVKDKSNREASQFTRDPMNLYVHHVITFADGTTLEFSDKRKFGWLRAVKTSELMSLKSVAELGVDALSPKLTLKNFPDLFSRRLARPVGEVLLDQGLIAGIGNIYRSEALFLAGVLPTRRVKDLKANEWQKLLAAIKSVLRRAVKMRGTSDSDFRDTSGLPGNFQRVLYVYRRAGKPCRKCGKIIKRQKLGQRSVFYCPVCQQ